MSSDDEDFVMDGSPPPVVSKPGKKKTASENYQKLTQLEHILKRPDTYVGSVERFESEQWVYNEESEAMELKKVNIVPGLFKIFDEILVNAADNKIRDPTMKRIDVKIDGAANLISVKNDGKGIPVEIHTKEKMYIPELIFGNLLTSSNYDDKEKKVTGGRNGYGAKLCNIFSTEFTVRTADRNTGKTYTQTWHNNMSVVDKPQIRTMKTKTEYTEIEFRPDLAKFGMDTLDADILGVLRRRVVDLCGSVKGIRVSLNGKTLKVRNFKQYTELYVKALAERNGQEGVVVEKEKEGKSGEDKEGDKDGSQSAPPESSETTPPPPTPATPANPLIYQTLNERWEVAFSVSDGTFHQVSFVNSIATTAGGTHVETITNMLVTKIIEYVKKKHRRAMLRPFQVKNNIFLFVNCLIENPAFTSQTKEQLTTRPSQYGGRKLELPDNFMKKVFNSGILDQVLNIAEANEEKALKKNDGTRKNRITGYPKLEDANRAGTREGHKCTLILTEGDSAQTLAVAGLAVVGRNYYGCYPLRGKMLNVREASTGQIMNNKEIQAIKQIMGLHHKKHYDEQNVKTLRYGHLMIMTDQDTDGSHIKGLIINFLETSFPGLLEVPNFLIEFITPIVKVTVLSGPNRRKVTAFYNMPEYEHWRDTEGTTCSYKHKYYKGLGTSSPEEMREYFSKLDKHLKKFDTLREGDGGYIDLAFSKKKADDRKEWLRRFQPGTFLDPDLEEIPISDFINKELILYSMADNIRSIPSVVDGFKPAQRKILYGCYKRNLKGEIKVSQLEGYIAEHTGYHHGDASLLQTIISLAQDFVGANNINLLFPHGGFGSRNTGGKDAAAARYIFTELSEITRKIFNPLDNQLLKYLKDDEQTVEPEWYVPVVPMVLVNGAEGIGSGWSTSIPQYNPEDIVANIRRLMNGEDQLEMVPWYKGWTGEIRQTAHDKFRVEGLAHQEDEDTVIITELPIHMWTITMKEYLLKGLAGNEKQSAWIKDMEEDHGVGIRFIVRLSEAEMTKALGVGLKDKFKLVSSISTSNMVLFDAQGRIKKYDNVAQILSDYYQVRLDYYQRRKDYMVTDLSNQLEKLASQARFIKMIIDGDLVVQNKRRPVVIEELKKNGFPGFDKNGNPVRITGDDVDVKDEEAAQEEEQEEAALSQAAEAETGMVVNNSRSVSSLYDYLLGMQIWSLTQERYNRLLKQRDDKEAQLTELLGKTAKDLWNTDLDTFLEAWRKFLAEDEERKKSMIPDAATKGKKKRRRTTKKAATKTAEKTKEPKAKKAKVKKETPEIKEEEDDSPFKSVFGKSAFNSALSEFNSSTDTVSTEGTAGTTGTASTASSKTKATKSKTKAQAKPRATKAKSKAKTSRKKKVESDSDSDVDDFSSGPDDEVVVAVKHERRSGPAKSYKIAADDDEIVELDDDDEDAVVELDDEDSDGSYFEE